MATRHQAIVPETVLGDIAALLKHRAFEKRVELHVHTRPATPEIVVEHAAFKQVVYALLDNAITFVRLGGRVVVTASPLPDVGVMTGAAVAITVIADDDAVAAPERDERLVERGYDQLEPDYAGPSAGQHARRLASARKVAEILGSTLRVSSTTGRSIFTWVVPAAPRSSQSWSSDHP